MSTVSNLEDYRSRGSRVASLKTGGGGGTFDDMEVRVQRLEDDMKEVKSDLKALRVDVAEMKGMMKAMPTTLQLIAFAVAVFVAAGLTRYFLPA